MKRILDALETVGWFIFACCLLAATASALTFFPILDLFK